jgi:hypothetical protein
MSLLSRVLKLEKRAVKPFKPVEVIFQQPDESDEIGVNRAKVANRSEEHTSELQSRV